MLADYKFSFYEAVEMLPQKIKTELKASVKDSEEVFEIRLIDGCRPLIVTSSGKKKARSFLNKRDLEESVLSLTGYSYHSYQKEIQEGFIPLKGGHRAGLAGTVCYDNDRISALKNINGIVIRVANDVDIDTDIKQIFKGENITSVLISGPPCSGKTTLLRKLAKDLAMRNYSVVVVDERQELYKGLESCMVIKGVHKAEGIKMAVKSLSPQVIVTDETSSFEEACEIVKAINCGVRVIASIHSENLTELKKKKAAKVLLSSGEFKRAVFLKPYPEAGKILEICDLT